MVIEAGPQLAVWPNPNNLRPGHDELRKTIQPNKGLVRLVTESCFLQFQFLQGVLRLSTNIEKVDSLGIQKKAFM